MESFPYSVFNLYSINTECCFESLLLLILVFDKNIHVILDQFNTLTVALLVKQKVKRVLIKEGKSVRSNFQVNININFVMRKIKFIP